MNRITLKFTPKRQAFKRQAFKHLALKHLSLKHLAIASFSAFCLCVTSNVGFAQSEDDEKLAEQLEKASVVCLVEVTSVDDRDRRPVDGNWTTQLNFKILKASGDAPATVNLIRAYGGRRRRPAPPQVVLPGLMEKGKQMWLIFHDDQIVRCWAEDDDALPKSVVAAVDQGKKIDVAELIEKSKAICLIEVTDVSEKDGRPYDGNYEVLVSFKVINGTGKAPAKLHLVKAYGGRRAGPPPALPTVLKHDSLKKGEKHYLVFSDQYDAEKYPHGIAAWWPEKSKKLPKEIVEAIKAKAKDSK